MEREIVYEYEMDEFEDAFDDFERLNHLGEYANENPFDYKSCCDVTEEECYTGGKNCSTCMHCRSYYNCGESWKKEINEDTLPWCGMCKR